MKEDNNNKIHQFIAKKKHLIWWTQNFDNLSDESVVEAVLSYGNWNDVQELINCIGIEAVAIIFEKQLQKKRVNYSERTKKYFTLYFKEHV